MSYIKNKRDRNERAIVSLWQSLGCHCIQMDRNAGFDQLVISPYRVAIVEIKNPETYWKLEDAEEKCKANVEAAGGTYWIVTNDREALEAAGYDVA